MADTDQAKDSAKRRPGEEIGGNSTDNGGSLVSSGVDIPLKNKEMGPLKRIERFPEGEFYPVFT